VKAGISNSPKISSAQDEKRGRDDVTANGPPNGPQARNGVTLSGVDPSRDSEEDWPSRDGDQTLHPNPISNGMDPRHAHATPDR
jgi:hypothetical protein